MEGKGTTRADESCSNPEAVASEHISCRPAPNSNFNIIYTNADTFINKREELVGLMQSLAIKPASIIINEVNPKANGEGLQESEFSLSGYNLYSVNIGRIKKRVV